MADITLEYSIKLTDAKLLGKQVPRGWLVELISTKKKEFGDSRPIRKETIRTCLKAGKSLDPKHPGAVLPMAESEITIVKLCI